MTRPCSEPLPVVSSCPSPARPNPKSSYAVRSLPQSSSQAAQDTMGLRNRYFLVDAFTSHEDTNILGNPAGVVITSEPLRDAEASALAMYAGRPPVRSTGFGVRVLTPLLLNYIRITLLVDACRSRRLPSCPTPTFSRTRTNRQRERSPSHGSRLMVCSIRPGVVLLLTRLTFPSLRYRRVHPSLWTRNARSERPPLLAVPAGQAIDDHIPHSTRRHAEDHPQRHARWSGRRRNVLPSSAALAGA